MAPEIILGKGYTETADWFSFGSILYDMLTGKPPFYSKNKHEIQKNIISKPVPLPESLSENARSLLKQLFKIKPENRIGSRWGAKEVKEHAFFSEINFERLVRREIKPPITFVENELNDEGFD
jgi:serine/threonine protein kinase